MVSNVLLYFSLFKRLSSFANGLKNVEIFKEIYNGTSQDAWMNEKYIYLIRMELAILLTCYCNYVCKYIHSSEVWYVCQKSFYLFRIKSYLHKSHKEKEDYVKIEIVVTGIESEHGQHETRQVDKWKYNNINEYNKIEYNINSKLWVLSKINLKFKIHAFSGVLLF